MHMVMEAEDRAKSLVEQAKAGDRAAFDTLLRDYQPRLERLVAARLGRQLRETVETEDILQEALLRAFRSLATFEWQRDDAFFAWLAGIVKNVIRTASQKGGRHRWIELETDVAATHTSPSKGLRREERFDRLQEALGKLSADHREVILLARIERLRIKEIAERMGRSPEATKQLLVRALRKLKGCFGETESLGLPERRLGEDETRG